MRGMTHEAGNRTRRYLTAIIALTLAATFAGPSLAVAPDQSWRDTLDLALGGEFLKAAEAAQRLPVDDPLAVEARSWLAEYKKQQEERAALDKAEFDMFVGYAKDRAEREEYDLALQQALRAADVAADRDALLTAPWMRDLADKALAKAQTFRDKTDWRRAWDIYWRLAELYDREPRYQKLERDMVTHWRLAQMFDEENWQEPLEKVRWSDAKAALEYIELYYVKNADFRKIAEGGLEQLLLLAESKGAQAHFSGLRSEADRTDFEGRLRVRLHHVRTADAVSRADTVRHFRRVVKDINEETIRLPEELIVSELMRGALEPLDEFTTIIWPEDSDEFDKHTRGDFVGIGVQIVKNRMTDEIEVVSPLEDTPAYEAGVQTGDTILAVDGHKIKGMSINKVVDIITGPIHSEVMLTIRRNGEEFELPLLRDKIEIRSVKGIERDKKDKWRYWLDEERGIGYIRIANFQRNTLEDMHNVLANLDAQGLSGLVLDLRGNPGGLLDSAWGVSSTFLKKDDTVVSTKGRRSDENQVFVTPHDGGYAGLPLVVLVDEHSASASEIVAGAVRDNGRGVVVGARTFGKFSVQNLIKLGRSNAKLKLTTAKYYLPSGVSLHRDLDSETWGVDPNIPIRLVQWEKVSLQLKRRAAEKIGNGAHDADDKNTDDKEADKSDTDNSTKTADATKTDDTTKPEEDELVSRFQQPFQLNWGKIEVDDDKAQADAKPATGEAKPTATEEPEKPKKPVRLVRDGQGTVEYTAKDANGNPVTVWDLTIGARDLTLQAVDADGKAVEVAQLIVAGREAERITLPLLDQPEENNRPDRDPQLDAALLLMRMTLLEKGHPTLAAVDDKTDADRRRP